jgi:membrane associated rhomboid family serine protease
MENFPVVTYSLVIINFAVFIFSWQHLSYYESNFGFIPVVFKPYTLVTYMFLHADLTHIILNMIMLAAVGFAIEEVLGKIFFFEVYIFSGIIATFFDTFGRLIFGISFGIPFIGASGAIFGLLAVGSLIKPFEKMPTFLVVISIIPLVMMLLSQNQDIFLTNPMALGIIVFVLAMATVFIFIFFPGMPLMFSLLIYGIFWVLLIYNGFTSSVSYAGHIGGILGGVIGFILLAKKK